MSSPSPKLVIAINNWTLFGHPSPENEWTLEERLAAIKQAGFDAFTWLPSEPRTRELLQKHGLRYGGFFDAKDPAGFDAKIKAAVAIENGPINCQLADHDTPTDEATRLTIQLMEAAARHGARVHLEVHRDTCTETPEKTAAIIAGYKQATGKIPLVNYDFSHPASVKHLHAGNYIERLFDDLETFQHANLWHIRPFNGHHCQVPVTDCKGCFSPEYEELRPFIRQAFIHWLNGPRPTGEFWVVPELGPKIGYGLSAFPCIWEDAIVLGNDLRKIWNEALAELG